MPYLRKDDTNRQAMTPAQTDARTEKLGFLVYDCGMTRREAERWCNARRDVYGYVEIKEEQGELI